ELLVPRHRAPPFRPKFLLADEIPNTKPETVHADRKVPGGLVGLYGGRGRFEAPMWLPEHRVVVFGDALTERGGDLRVWDCRAGHEKRELPALRAMLELPFERVIISHCDNEPVQTRADFEKALERPPWKD